MKLTLVYLLALSVNRYLVPYTLLISLHTKVQRQTSRSCNLPDDCKFSQMSDNKKIKKKEIEGEKRPNMMILADDYMNKKWYLL